MNKLVEKEEEMVVHENENYRVISTPDSQRGNYSVINKSWGGEEGVFENLPSALSVCEQMNNILVHSIWKKQAEEALEEALYTQPAEDDYDKDFFKMQEENGEDIDGNSQPH